MIHTRLFISKSVDELELLPEFCMQHSIELIAHSFLHFREEKAVIQQPYDVLFFASPRAVNFFLSQFTPDQHTQIACAGKSTAKKLETLGYPVDYIAPYSSSPLESAEDFARWVGSRKVVFPVSSISRATYTHFIPNQQVRQLVVYTTLVEGKTVPSADMYVFTSPSNVEGFFRNNHSAEGKIIAWGETTAQALLSDHDITAHVLSESSESALISYLSVEIDNDAGNT